jgi:hypothetical protein
MSTRVQHIRGTTSEVESVTPLPGELGFDTEKKEPHLGDGATAGGIRLAKKNISEIVVAAQLTGNTNDYAPTNVKHAGALVISTDAARDITGLVPSTVTDSTDGREITIYNGGSFNATLKDQSASSAAANRFDLGGADLVLSPKTSATLRYRLGISRWELKAQTAGAAVAASAVIARTLAASALGFSMVNGTLTESHSAGAVTYAIKTLTGADPSVSDPVLVILRNGTLASGDFSMMTLTAAASVTVSSGSSLGTSNGAAFKVWLVGFNDAGTFRMGVVNALDGASAVAVLTPDQLASSTAEGGAGAADSALVFYTGTAVASKPYAVLGYADYPSGQAAAGTWATAPTTLQLYHAAVPLPGRNPAAQVRNLASPLINGTLVPSVSGNALTVAIKTLAGNDPSPTDPVYIVTRSVTAANGDFTVTALTSATSITVPAGSTLGTSNNVPFRLWLVNFLDGTPRLGLVNCVSGGSIYPLGQFPLASASVLPGSSAQTIYVQGPAGAVFAKPYEVLGYLGWESGLAAAGTWSAGPTRTQLYMPGTPLPGTLVQPSRFSTGASATGTTSIPVDDTIPQITEGDQFMAVSITPTSAANLLKVEASALISINAVGASATALFRDSGANAVAASAGHFYASGVVQERHLDYVALAGSVSATTFSLRAGGGGTVTFNGAGGSRLFGGVANSSMEIRELMG